MTELQWRDLDLLRVHRETLQCASTRCIACCYKIVLHSRPGLLPNVRPEMCPRMKPKEQEASGQHAIGLYNADTVKTILTLGDGNFSYSLALARALPDIKLVATSHESKQSVLETYPDGETILEELNAMPHVTVLHQVDAMDGQQLQKLGSFDRVIWNFPCVRAQSGADGQNQEMEVNKKLLNDFFAVVGAVLTETGEVHVTHKTKAPFGQWGIEKIAASNKLRHQQSVVFDRCLYPGYTNKKVLDKKSFPIWDSLTFVFVPESRTQPTAEEKTDGEADESTDMTVPVTMDILKKMYLLLTPSLDEVMGGKKKKRRNGWSGGKDSKDSKESNNKRKQPSKATKQRPGKKKPRRS